MNFASKKVSITDEQLLEKVSTLTSREKEAYEFLMEGYRLNEVAEKMDVKFSTINSYTKAIYKKLNVHSQKQLIIKFYPVFNSREKENF